MQVNWKGKRESTLYKRRNPLKKKHIELEGTTDKETKGKQTEKEITWYRKANHYDATKLERRK